MNGMFKKLVILALSVSLLGAGAAVTDVRGPVGPGGHFIPITREEFLTRKAAAEGVTYAEAAQALDAELAAAIAALPGPGPEATGASGAAPEIAYGTVYDYNQHPSGMGAYFYVDAVKLSGPGGPRFVSLGAAGAKADGNGAYDLEKGSTATANIINDNRQIRLAFTGIYVAEEPVSRKTGFRFLFFHFGETTTRTNYHRSDVVLDTHIEDA